MKAKSKCSGSHKVRNEDGTTNKVMTEIVNKYFSSGNTEIGTDEIVDPVDALCDLQTVFTRMSVITAHVQDLVQAQTPEAYRALALLTELNRLSLDGLDRISQTGLEL